jgi:hypothetical protein
MSDAIEQTTQMQDAKPLKDWRKFIAASALPDDGKRLIETVVRRTRLWKRERASVARELIAHFHDAADAGVSSEEAIKRFGDAKQAAKLIRRAKIRNRSWLWHARRFVQRVIGVLILCYIGVGIYYFSGKPSPSVDYIAKLNAPILATPESEWAWPLYREALAALRPGLMPIAMGPEDPDWDKTVAWLDAHWAELALAREAAHKPVFGSLHSQSFAAEDAKLFAIEHQPERDGLTARALVAVMLPQLNQMRDVADAFAADAARAIELGQGDRAYADIAALLSMSDQLRKRDFLVTDLVSLGIRSLAQKALARALEKSPSLLSDQQLRAFARADVRLQTAGDLISYQGERYMFYDLVQRTYTDDGQGDGRITATAMHFMRRATDRQRELADSGHASSDEWLREPIALATAPTVLMLSPSRKDLVEKYDELMDSAENRLSKNLRDLPPGDTDASLTGFKRSALDSLRYVTRSASLGRSQVQAERAIGQGEGLRVAIALELYRRERGAYPTSLDVLVPQYLPAVPADRITGEPLCYRLRDGKPLIYSRGVDRDDDGGVAPTVDGEPRPQAASVGGQNVDGDWILFPRR